MSDKLSALIRKGCAVHPMQAFVKYARWEGDQIVATCAIGAAWVGAGYTDGPLADEETPMDWVLERLGQAPHKKIPAPPNENDFVRMMPLYDLVRYLNDNRTWRREEIADYLEGQGL